MEKTPDTLCSPVVLDGDCAGDELRRDGGLAGEGRSGGGEYREGEELWCGWRNRKCDGFDVLMVSIC